MPKLIQTNEGAIAKIDVAQLQKDLNKTWDKGVGTIIRELKKAPVWDTRWSDDLNRGKHKLQGVLNTLGDLGTKV